MKAYEDLYTRLDAREWDKYIYKLAKSRERKTRDVNQVKCIKGDDSTILENDEETKDRWKRYSEKLLKWKTLENLEEEEYGSCA